MKSTKSLQFLLRPFRLQEYAAENGPIAEHSEDGKPKKSENYVVGDFYFGPPVFEEVRILNSNVSPFFANHGYRFVRVRINVSCLAMVTVLCSPNSAKLPVNTLTRTI